MELTYSKSISNNLKIIGIISMVIDHVGYLFFPNIALFRIIGRLAFPIFAAGIASGYQHTSSFEKYILRLSIFAIISQIPYQLLKGVFHLNILFTLSIGLLLIYFFDKKNYPFFSFFILLSLFAPIEYSFLGPITIFTFFFLKNKKQIIMTYLFLVFVYIITKNTSLYLISFYSLFGITLVLYPKILKNIKLPKFPKYFFYIFYPVHLILLIIIKLAIQ